MKRLIELAFVTFVAFSSFGASGTRMSDYPELPSIEDADIFVVTRPGDDTYKYSWNQVLSSIGLAIKEFSITNEPTVQLKDGTSASLSADTPIPVVGLIGRKNFEIARSTLETGLTNGQCMAPEIVWTDVALSATNAITILHFVFFSGDATTTNDFRLHICRAPVTWGETNANWNAVATEIGTNLLATIESSDTTMGKWYDVGKTNRAWRSYPIALAVKPATNSLFLYFEAAATVTNFNGAWGTFTYWQ